MSDADMNIDTPHDKMGTALVAPSDVRAPPSERPRNSAVAMTTRPMGPTQAPLTLRINKTFLWRSLSSPSGSQSVPSTPDEKDMSLMRKDGQETEKTENAPTGLKRGKLNRLDSCPADLASMGQEQNHGLHKTASVPDNLGSIPGAITKSVSSDDLNTSMEFSKSWANDSVGSSGYGDSLSRSSSPSASPAPKAETPPPAVQVTTPPITYKHRPVGGILSAFLLRMPATENKHKIDTIKETTELTDDAMAEVSKVMGSGKGQGQIKGDKVKPQRTLMRKVRNRDINSWAPNSM